MLRSLGLIALLTSTAIPAAATPLMPKGQGESGAHPLIYGGSATQSCMWPSTVILKIVSGQDVFLCSGSLINPSVVVYAAHCGDGVQSIGFGDSTFVNAQKIVTPKQCKVYPGHNPENGTDFAYCSLSEPITGVPITPILMGCELSVLRPNKPVTLVGFGLSDGATQADGIKRQVVTQQDALVANKAFVGGSGKDTCFGDSGGPAYVQLTDSDNLPGVADNAWRVYGITSYGLSSTCGSGSYDSIMSYAVPWVEADSGIDITPCTDANGTWGPGPDCGGFPMHPNESQGAWSSLCSRTDVSGYSATCGPPYDAASPISISFTDPAGGKKATISNALTAELKVTDSDPQGGPLAVSLAYDGTALSRQGSGSTYKFGPHTLDMGDHTLLAVATDAHGNKRVEQLNLSVAEPKGCQQSSGMLGWVAVAAAAWLLRRRTGSVGTLALVALCLIPAGCGTKVDVDADALRTVTTSANPDINPNFQPPPTVSLDFTGTVAGQTLVPKSALFYYSEYQDSTTGAVQTVLYMFTSDQNAYCDTILSGEKTQGSKGMMFILVDNGANADAPLNGTYAILDPNATDAPSNATGYGYAQFVANNAGDCNNMLSDPQSYATSGSLTLKSIMSVAGGYMDFTFTGVSVGTQGDTISGHITALGCAQSENTAQSFQCVAPTN